MPVPTPADLSPVGAFTMPRSAKATGSCRDCDRTFTLAPTYRSPTWLPVKPVVTNGYRASTPMARELELWDPNSGRRSRSTRESAANEPNSSTRPPRPTPNVPAKSDTLVKPGTLLKPARYPLTDHAPRASTSAVGTNHRPVSP